MNIVLKAWPTLVVGALAACSFRGPVDFPELDQADHLYERPFAAGPSPERRIQEEILKKGELSLEDVLAIADVLNPDLNDARKSVDLTTAMVWDASLYPNPLLLYQLDDYHPKSGGAPWSDSKNTVGVAVPLVVGGRIHAGIRMAEAQRDKATSDYVWMRRDTLSQVKKAFLGIVANQQSLALMRNTVQLIRNFHDLAEERFKLRAIPEMELLKSTVELANAENDLRQVEKNLAVAVKTLHSLLGNIDLSNEKFRGNLPDKYVLPAIDELRTRIVQKHPLLESARKEKEIHEREVEMLKASIVPDIQLQALLGTDSSNDTVLLGGVSIGLPVFDRNQAKIAMARIAIRRADLHFQSQWNDIILKLDQFHREVETAQARVSSYAVKILPSAQKALEQTTEGYKLGRFNYLDVLDAQRTLMNARAAYSDALLDLSTSASELEKLIGSRLEVAK